MPILKNMSQKEIIERKKEKTKERNKRNNERLKEAREYFYRNKTNSLIKCVTCEKEKGIEDFYKSTLNVKFENKKPVDISSGECKACARNKQKQRDRQKAY